jgi:signal transduction histidine kinase
MTRKKLKFYNYFFLLALALISGYYVTSLVLINKTNYSGEQADLYGEISEQADAILKYAYRMEAYANGFLLTGNQDTYIKYSGKVCALKQQFIELTDNCKKNELAVGHVEELSGLIYARLNNIQSLVTTDSLHHMSNEERIEMLEEGSYLMDEIKEVLYDIRRASGELKKENKSKANESATNTLVLITLFGLVMIIMAFISFNQMRSEIQKNEKNAEEIAQFNIELKSMNENLESFAYVASHDLNEPLRKIRTFGDMIHEEMNQKEPDMELVKNNIVRMQDSASRMQQLITDLLAYSRISRQNETFEKVNLTAVLQNVESDLRVPLEKTHGKIIIEQLPDFIHANSTQVHQLFQNLISNALKFRKPEIDPEIRICCQLVEGKQIKDERVNLLPEKSYWKFTISDNGIGFNNEYAEKIFMIFQRLHGRSEYEGTGIGLSICKKICEQHRGDISAYGEEGIGATFCAYIQKQ